MTYYNKNRASEFWVVLGAVIVGFIAFIVIMGVVGWIIAGA